MPFFKYILSHIGKSRLQQARPIALESSELRKLPRELIYKISSFLPPESAASFTLCCRPIYFMLGTQYLEALEAEDDQSDKRFKFLTLLELDLPDYIPCYHCKKLHAISKAQQHMHHDRYDIGWDNYLPCWKVDNTECMQVYIHRRFSSTIFQMMMKLYRQGLDYSKLLKLLSYKATLDHYQFYQPEIVDMALARIVADGALLVRVQQILIKPEPISIPWHPYLVVCPHIRFASNHAFNQHGDIVQWEYSHERTTHENGKGIIQCDYCLTEFRVDFKSFGKEGTAIVVTKWQELGEGRSYLDQKWQSHLRWNIANGKYLVPVDFDRGSLCARFEGEKHYLFEYDRVLSPSDWERLLSSYK